MDAQMYHHTVAVQEMTYAEGVCDAGDTNQTLGYSITQYSTYWVPTWGKYANSRKEDGGQGTILFLKDT